MSNVCLFLIKYNVFDAVNVVFLLKQTCCYKSAIFNLIWKPQCAICNMITVMLFLTCCYLDFDLVSVMLWRKKSIIVVVKLSHGCNRFNTK